MLSFLASNPPPRTKTAHLNPIPLDDGRSSAEFKGPGDNYLVINHLPPAAFDQDVTTVRVPNKANCSLAPPLHSHSNQEETFHVLEGIARFTIAGRAQIATAGDVIVIPQRKIHTFCNASEEMGLVVEFVLDPSSRAGDEAYFRNIWTYRDDCRKAGSPGSRFQVLLFMYRAGTVLAWPRLGFVSRPLGVLWNLLGGLVIGKWILGYSDSYLEYFHPSSQ